MCDHNTSFGLISILYHFTQYICHRKQHCRAAVWVDGAKSPGIEVASHDNPLIRIFRTFNNTYHIGDRFQFCRLIYFDIHLDRGVTGQTIGKGQASLPILIWDRSTIHLLQYFLSRSVRERSNRDGMKTDIVRCESFDFNITVDRQGRFVWREWIAVVLSRQSRSALDSTFTYKLTFRVGGAVYIAAVGRIGIYNETNSSVLLGIFGFVTAEVSAITGNHNFPFH